MKLLTSGWIQRSELKRPIRYLSLHQNISREDEEPMFQDLKEHDQREPVTIDQKFNLLDGYTRDEFLEELEKPKIKFIQYQFESESEKLAYIVSKNRMRRHLSTYQKCEWAIPVYEQAKKEAEKRQKKGTLAYKNAKGKATEIAAKSTGVSTSTFEQYLTLRNSPARVNKQMSLESGKATIKTVYLQITRKERNLPKIKLPKEISDVFYCDVPIGYRNQGGRGAAANHYPTMTPEELVEEFKHIAAADNAVIFFWMSPSICYDEIPIQYNHPDIEGNGVVVNTPIYKAILDAAGFKVKAEFVWKKDKWGLGSWNRNQHENLFFAIKGNMPTPAKLFSSVIEAIRTSHSRKPNLWPMIKEMYPKRNYQEFYAREKTPGVKAHGNQIKMGAPVIAS